MKKLYNLPSLSLIVVSACMSLLHAQSNINVSPAQLTFNSQNGSTAAPQHLVYPQQTVLPPPSVPRQRPVGNWLQVTPL